MHRNKNNHEWNQNREGREGNLQGLAKRSSGPDIVLCKDDQCRSKTTFTIQKNPKPKELRSERVGGRRMARVLTPELRWIKKENVIVRESREEWNMDVSLGHCSASVLFCSALTCYYSSLSTADLNPYLH